MKIFQECAFPELFYQGESSLTRVSQWIVEGYSTIFKEIDAQLGGVRPDWIIIPVGIGGLAQAAVTHYKTSIAGHITRILTVEPETAASLYTSLKKGELSIVETGETILKGMNYGTVANAAWPVLQAGVDASVIVPDEEVKEGMKDLKGDDIEVGPCGGAVVAALKNVLGDQETRNALGLGEDATVVLIGTEGLNHS